ncbi:MAG TPA: redox-sensitive transcriptional activator SoxR [Candidatus Dormibacteraeota bacterium]|jgi:MerR family redox-sensitive transcriptional activator SoxR|nr:redox-sensitive transcriptional activator SoxR [Candidatus Dormibacteraeota bacterium]
MADELTIGELSARSGVAPSALRFYEARGLIAASRTDGNQRRYARATLRRLALVQAGRAAGIPLRQIRVALETLPADRTPTRQDWERLSRLWRADLDRRIATLQALRDRLTTCIGCGCLSIDRCTLLNPGDEAAALGPGARYLQADGGRGAREGRSEQRTPPGSSPSSASSCSERRAASGCCRSGSDPPRPTRWPCT